jgi:hypothetical protein
MLYAGLDLSRKRLDFHLLDGEGATVEVGAAPPDADGLRGLSERVGRHGAPIRAAIESMNGARFVHDRLELAGWQVDIADAQKVKGLAPLACKTDRRRRPGAYGDAPSRAPASGLVDSGRPTRRWDRSSVTSPFLCFDQPSRSGLKPASLSQRLLLFTFTVRLVGDA